MGVYKLETHACFWWSSHAGHQTGSRIWGSYHWKSLRQGTEVGMLKLHSWEGVVLSKSLNQTVIRPWIKETYIEMGDTESNAPQTGSGSGTLAFTSWNQAPTFRLMSTGLSLIISVPRTKAHILMWTFLKFSSSTHTWLSLCSSSLIISRMCYILRVVYSHLLVLVFRELAVTGPHWYSSITFQHGCQGRCRFSAGMWDWTLRRGLTVKRTVRDTAL